MTCARAHNSLPLAHNLATSPHACSALATLCDPGTQAECGAQMGGGGDGGPCATHIAIDLTNVEGAGDKAHAGWLGP